MHEDYTRAIEAHDKAIALKSDYEIAWVNKGIALRLNKQPEEAKKAYEKALSIDDKYAEAWASLGALQRHRQIMQHQAITSRRLRQWIPRLKLNHLAL